MQSYQQPLPNLFTSRSYGKGVMEVVSIDKTSGLLSLVGGGSLLLQSVLAPGCSICGGPRALLCWAGLSSW